MKATGRLTTAKAGSRRYFNRKQRAELKRYYNRKPRPYSTELSRLAAKLGVDKHRLSVWFRNQRHYRKKGASRGWEVERRVIGLDDLGMTPGRFVHAEVDPDGVLWYHLRWNHPNGTAAVELIRAEDARRFPEQLIDYLERQLGWCG